MTEDNKKEDLGLASFKANFTIGLSLLIWSLAGIAFEASTTGFTVASWSVIFAFAFPPLGAYMVISSFIDIQRVLQKEQQ